MKKIIYILAILIVGAYISYKLFYLQEQTQVVILEDLIVQTTSPEHFKKEILETKIPTVIKFESEWCGSCKEMIPMFKKLASKYKGRVKFIKVDVSKYPSIAKDYEIVGVPAVVFIKDGKNIEKIEGQISKNELNETIKDEFEIE